MNESIWQLHTKSMPFTRLEKSDHYNATVIGAGICGIYTAYLLAKRGLKVLLVEASESIGGGATKRSTGKLTAQHGAIYHQLKDEERMPYYQANENSIHAALDLLPHDAYEKVTSYLFCENEKDEKTLRDEFACYEKLPFNAIASNEIELPVTVRLAIGMPDMYQINPAYFTNKLVELAMQAGVTIHTSTRITKLNMTKKIVTSDDDVSVTSDHIILCTHYPIESIRNLYTAKLKVDRSYLCATPTFDHIPNHYISIGQNARTIRTALINNKKYFIYGGGSHLAGTVQDTQPFYNVLESELKEVYSIDEKPHFWSSQDVDTADYMPYIGRLLKNEDAFYIATGFKKWGLSTSLVAAEIIARSIFHEAHPAMHLFDPHRSISGTQFVNSLAQGGFVVEQFISGHATRMNAPKCTHLGCRTRWNEADRTWDCPCHGSRFGEDGHVIEGPAVYPLKFD